jgi:hypothetical protein
MEIPAAALLSVSPNPLNFRIAHYTPGTDYTDVNHLFQAGEQ